MKLALIPPLLLVGCVTMSPQEMSSRSNWDVCRFTMGGPHSMAAQNEARSRSLDCAPLYPAIAAQQQSQNAATQNLINTLNPPRPAPIFPQQTNCTSRRAGNTVQTNCW